MRQTNVNLRSTRVFPEKAFSTVQDILQMCVRLFFERYCFAQFTIFTVPFGYKLCLLSEWQTRRTSQSLLRAVCVVQRSVEG